MPLPENLLHLIRPDEPLAPYTWLGIGGPARYFAEPSDREELLALVRAASAEGIPVRVLGGGSNLLVREAGFDGLVLSLEAADFSRVEAKRDALTTGGGAKLSHAVSHAVGKGLAGLEHLVGVPGTVGAAIIGNVSAGASDIGQVVHQVESLSAEGETKIRDASDLRFSYRHCDFDDLLVLSATFRLEPGDPLALTKRMQKLWIVRRGARPQGEMRVVMPFVDPDGAPAEALIEQVGLRGIRRGPVSLDAAHPAYLVAHQGATSEDVLGLIDTVCEQVSRQMGIDLQLNLKVW